MGTTLTPFNQGQLVQLQNNINIAVATALPKVAEKFEPKTLLKALEGKGQILADRLEPLLEQVLNGFFLLGTPGTVIVTIAERHDPEVFFKIRGGLYVWDEFRNRVVSKAKPTEAGATFRLAQALLLKQMGDEEIEASLPKAHVFDDSIVCAVIASMIKEQPEGKEGKLLNSGYANLFYMHSCVVDVFWDAGDRRWRVRAWRRGDYEWDVGGQVFSPATVA